MTAFDNSVDRAVEYLKSGGVILTPTDTIWGLSCLANKPPLVQRIYSIKKRDASKPLISLVSDLPMLEKLTGRLPSWLLKKVESLSNSTFIYKNCHKGLAEVLYGEQSSLAIRWVRSGTIHAIIDRVGEPIVSTSANLSGDLPPVSISNVSEGVKSAVDFIVPISSEEILPSQASKIFVVDYEKEALQQVR